MEDRPRWENQIRSIEDMEVGKQYWMIFHDSSIPFAYLGSVRLDYGANGFKWVDLDGIAGISECCQYSLEPYPYDYWSSAYISKVKSDSVPVYSKNELSPEDLDWFDWDNE